MSKSKTYMRATDWNAKKAIFPAFVQPKHNGIRFIYDGDIALTREENPHADHIQRMIKKAWPNVPDGWKVDGEACFPIEMGISIQRTNGAVKKEKELSKHLIFPVFDGFDYGLTRTHTRFSARFTYVHGDCHTVPVTCIEEVDHLYEKWIAEGWEGLIFRTDSPYRFGSGLERLMKRKPIKHAEFKIAAVWEGTGKAAGTPIYRLWRPGHGPGEVANYKTTFGASPDGPYDERKEMWEERDEVIGEMLTIRCGDFYDSGVPQFPIAETVRTLDGQ